MDVVGPRRAFVFAHGAGAGSSSAWIQRWTALLRPLGEVVTFDYPYMARGSKRPDPLPTLIAHHRRMLERFQTQVVLIGKSMGGRVGCHVAAEDPARVRACVCLGYPLVGAASRGGQRKLRDEVLYALRTPVLFVQGTRDALCPLDTLAAVRRRMDVRHELHVVDGADHSLELTKTRLRELGRTQADVDAKILAAIRKFLGIRTVEPPRSRSLDRKSPRARRDRRL